MDKDLEIIKKEKENYLFNHGIAEEPPEIKAIIIAAERMAEEIKHYRGLAKRFEESYNQAVTSLGDPIANMADEIARLKAELEKRLEVVKCEECKHKNICKKSIIFQKCTFKMQGSFEFYYLDYCSLGQRQEKETKK